jgi:DNA-binding NarL/FixJ family response regulator
VTILHLIDHGRSHDAISAALSYSVSTVKAEMQIAHRALRTHDRAGAVARAYELGILPLKPEKPAP